MKTLNFPELRQTYNYGCGAKAIQAVLIYYGFDIEEGGIMKLAGTQDHWIGTPINGLKRVATKYKLKFEARKMTLLDLKKFISKKVPVILLLQAWSDEKNIEYQKDWGDSHYVVVVGYDKEKFYFEDPWRTNRVALTYSELMARWHGINPLGSKKINFGMAVFGKPKYNIKKIIRMK